MAVPVLNFAAYNPMDVAVQTALGTYKGIGEGSNQQLQAQTAAKKLPYADQEIMAMINLHRAQAQQAQQEANFTKSIYDMINKQNPGMVSQTTPVVSDRPVQGAGVTQPTPNISAVPGQASPAMAAPSQGGPIAGYDSQADLVNAIIANKMGINPVSPMRQQQMDIDKYRIQQGISNQFENEQGTSGTKGGRQEKVLAIDAMMPDLIRLSQTNPPIPGFGWTSPTEKKDFDNLVSRLTESIVTAKGWPKTNESMDDARKMLRPTLFDTKETYQARIADLMRDIEHQRQVSAAQGFSTYKSDRLSTMSDAELDAELKRMK